jgi:hypothetical protein
VERDWAKGLGAVEFFEFGFDDLRDCRDIKVIVVDGEHYSGS